MQSFSKKDVEYSKIVLNIEREAVKPRKDMYKWSMVKDYYDYMFKDFNEINVDLKSVINLDGEFLCKLLNTYITIFSETQTKEEWFENMKKLADKHGFCLDNKEYKANPTKYNGNLAAFCNLIRYSFTGKTNTPDLHAICCVLGKKELFNRLDVLKKRLLNK